MVLKKVIIFLVKIYQLYISPLKLKPSCRFYPSCSEYAVQAIQKHGIFKGSIVSMWRILRCNPLHRGGFDPVK